MTATTFAAAKMPPPHECALADALPSRPWRHSSVSLLSRRDPPECKRLEIVAAVEHKTDHVAAARQAQDRLCRIARAPPVFHVLRQAFGRSDNLEVAQEEHALLPLRRCAVPERHFVVALFGDVHREVEPFSVADAAYSLWCAVHVLVHAPVRRLAECIALGAVEIRDALTAIIVHRRVDVARYRVGLPLEWTRLEKMARKVISERLPRSVDFAICQPMMNICDFSYFPLTGAFVQEGMCAIMASLERKRLGTMSLCYKKLWKQLIDRDMTRTDLRLATSISPSTSVSPVLPPDIMGVYVYLPEFNA